MAELYLGGGGERQKNWRHYHFFTDFVKTEKLKEYANNIQKKSRVKVLRFFSLKDVPEFLAQGAKRNNCFYER